MDIQVLAAEIDADPLGRGYAEMADSTLAESLNVPNRPGHRTVPAADVRRYVLLHGLWPRLQATAANPENPVNQGTAITILQTLAPNSFDDIRMQDPEVHAAVSAMLATMVTAGVISSADRNAMIALGDTMISRAEEIGLPVVHHLDVATARATLA